MYMSTHVSLPVITESISLSLVTLERFMVK